MKNLIKINLILLITFFFTNCKKENVDPVLLPNNTTNNVVNIVNTDTVQSVKDSLTYINLKNGKAFEYIKINYNDTIYEMFNSKSDIPNSAGLNFYNNGIKAIGNSSGLGIFLPEYIYINKGKQRLNSNQYLKLNISKIKLTFLVQGYIEYIKLNEKVVTHRGNGHPQIPGLPKDTSLNLILSYGLNIVNNKPFDHVGVKNIYTNDLTNNYNIIRNIEKTSYPINGHAGYNKTQFMVKGEFKMQMDVNPDKVSPEFDNKIIEGEYNVIGFFILNDVQDQNGSYYDSETNEYKCQFCF